MQYEAEKKFAEQYIRKDRRDRMIFELTNEKKRYDGLDRFSHESEKLLDFRKIVMKDLALSHHDEFREFVSNHAEPVTILSTDGFLDGRNCLFSEAVDLSSFSFEPVIILGEGFAYVKAEPEKGGTMQYLLSEK